MIGFDLSRLFCYCITHCNVALESDKQAADFADFVFCLNSPLTCYGALSYNEVADPSVREETMYGKENITGTDDQG